MSLDLTGFTNLVTLNCSSAGIVNTLDVTGLASLTTLDCNSNGGMTGLTLTGCTGLVTLDFSSTAVTAVTGLASCQGTLQTIGITNTPLLHLDLTGFASVSTISVGANISLLTLVLDGCTSLVGIVQFTNALSNFDALQTLNLNGCTGITGSDCDGNTNVSSLILSGCVNMVGFDCSGCSLITLDLSNLTSMSQIICNSQTTLTTLTLTNTSALTDIEGADCSLTGVDVGDCPLLTNILLSNNKLTSADVDQMLDDLVAFAQPAGYIEVNGQTPAAPPTPAKKAALEALWGVGNVNTD